MFSVANDAAVCMATVQVYASSIDAARRLSCIHHATLRVLTLPSLHAQSCFLLALFAAHPLTSYTGWAKKSEATNA